MFFLWLYRHHEMKFMKCLNDTVTLKKCAHDAKILAEAWIKDFDAGETKACGGNQA